MTGWSEIAKLGARVRPMAEPRPPAGDRKSAFTASLGATMEVLARELRALDAHDVVIELDLREKDLRVDGLPRMDARVSFPGVAVSFQSVHGPLRYATAEYATIPYWRGARPVWADNLRAIALSMEALRAVDRYGVSRRGEQYVGWRALPPGQGDAMTVQAARDLIASYGGEREALKATHPDHGGSTEAFSRVQRAREVLARA